MLLSQLFQKKIYTGETPRGVILGVGFSLKNYAVKHLLCATLENDNDQPQVPDFAVNVTAISAVADKISLTHLRPALPKAQAKLFPSLPVYSHDGIFLGNFIDGELQNFLLIRLTTDRGKTFSPSSIAICRDGIFLRKEQPYPLGQRVPSPMLSQLHSDSASVTKPLLRRAAHQGALIKLTLSLPPFSVLSASDD